MIKNFKRALRVIRAENDFSKMAGGRDYDVHLIKQELEFDEQFLDGVKPNDRGIWLLCWYLDLLWDFKVLWRVGVQGKHEIEADMITVWPY